jgi:hypothetical protein
VKIRFGFTGFQLAGAATSAFIVLAAAAASTPRVAAQEAMDGPGAAESKAKTGRVESREVFQAVQRLRAAVQAEKREGSKATAPLPSRPERTVTPPKLTSAELDRLLDAYLKQTNPKVETAPLTSDVEFVRRVYFDLAGVPPSPAQVASFVNRRGKDKRAHLIDELLASPESARNWARYWRDVIRFHATNQNPLQVRYDALEDWLAAQFAKNAPWDEIASSLISATGRVDENGAVSFALAHEAKPVELAGEVSRIFLGVQIQCAQCHDHKTDAWKREQFHEFAAFFSGVRPKPFERGMPGQLPVFGVVAQGRPRYTMPDKDVPTKQIPMAPRFFLASSGTPPALPEGIGAVERRALGASYITGQDNPWFARAFVNRIWYVLMGESFYDAIDDLGPERTPKAREVVERLADEWQKGGYDVRWLLRTIANTTAYQRRVRSTANPAGKTAFASNCPSRLRSDQIVQGLIEALGLPEDLIPANRPRAAERSPGSLAEPKKEAQKPKAKAAAAAAGLAGAPGTAKGQVKLVRQGGPRVLFNALFGIDPSVPNEDVLGTIPQALFLMNSPMVHNRTQARPGTVLGEILATAPDNHAALNALYLRVLSRQPTPKEVEACGHYLARVGNRAEAFEDIYWALVNSTEFISRR